MDCTQLHVSITQCVWTAAHALISSRNRLPYSTPVLRGLLHNGHGSLLLISVFFSWPSSEFILSSFPPHFYFNFFSCTSTSIVIGLAVITMLFIITILWFLHFFSLSISCCFILLLVIWCFISHYLLILLISLGSGICYFYWYFIFYDFSNILHPVVCLSLWFGVIYIFIFV